MLKRLQQKWKVGAVQLVLIICTFALGGSLTGYVARRGMYLTGIDRGLGWVIVYILLVTLLWPVAVLLVSIPFGQFSFFRDYLRRLGNRLGNRGGRPPGVDPINNEAVNICIFASGAGSNARRIIEEFNGNPRVKIALIACNKPGAGVLDIATAASIPTLLINREQFLRGDAYLPELHARNIGFIVLAGFLWKIPDALVKAFPRRIVNIHPALLPAYGGKGMYGAHVHRAVIAAGDTESGITIHYVDEEYDNGDVIFQARTPIPPGDTPETLATRIHELEHLHYPRVIAELLGVPVLK